MNTVEGIPGTNASEEYQTESLIRDEISEVHRLPYTIDQQDIAYRGKAKECYEDIVRRPRERCYNQYRGYPIVGNLFLYGATNVANLLDADQNREYQAVLLNWAITKESATFPPLGFADDNYRNGTQSFIFDFVSPGIANDLGYGLSTTEIHEYGHHLNLSHPFDGFDYENAVALENSGEAPQGRTTSRTGRTTWPWQATRTTR